jgi:hypothetical protein
MPVGALAVRLRRIGDDHLTPLLRASSTFAQNALVAIGSAPHETIRSDWVTDSGSRRRPADGEVPGRLAAGVAHGPFAGGGAEGVEQAVDQPAVDLPWCAPRVPSDAVPATLISPLGGDVSSGACPND